MECDQKKPFHSKYTILVWNILLFKNHTNTTHSYTINNIKYSSFVVHHCCALAFTYHFFYAYNFKEWEYKKNKRLFIYLLWKWMEK